MEEKCQQIEDEKDHRQIVFPVMASSQVTNQPFAGIDFTVLFFRILLGGLQT